MENLKQGTVRQCRATEFDKTPATGTSLCPFKGAGIAIVPVRYALDRSRYDPNPTARKLLPKTGKWPALPSIRSRTYTLRQLYDGYVYVFDETAGTFHEYAYSASDAGLQRIVWTDAHLGQDIRTGSGEAQPYLLYPRKNTLHIAYAPVQWTWRICEHMRSHEDSRALWMKRLDLAGYCITMNEPGTLPLSEVAKAVADVDAGEVHEDFRFYDAAIPSTKPPFNPQEGEAAWVPLGADVHWLGSVPDKDSALLIALDDPLAIVKDLGMQLAGDLAAYQTWQAHEQHKVDMAIAVTGLCGMPSQPDSKQSPWPWIKDDPVSIQQYLLDMEAYLEQLALEEAQALGSGTTLDVAQQPVTDPPSLRMHETLVQRYKPSPSTAEIQDWNARSKWRMQADLKAARLHLQQQLPILKRLQSQIENTRSDFRQWFEHIGIEPLKLFIDTANPNTLLYLQTITEELLTLWGQHDDAVGWINAQEDQATTLFGTLRYGFSAPLKEALHHQADRLLNGLGDITNLVTRAGELNAVLNHSGFADAAWMKALKQPVQDTFKAMKELATGRGKQVAQAILIALIPADSRLAQGKQPNLIALLRNFLIGKVLINTEGGTKIDEAFDKKLQAWERERLRLQRDLNIVQQRWFYPGKPWVRQSLTHDVNARDARLQAHDLKIPMLIDFRNNEYAKLFRQEIEKFFHSGKNVARHWQQHVRNVTQEWGIHGASISWSVIMLNFINTALVWQEVGRDGNLSAKDMVKVGYNLGYSFNLLMALYVEAPWEIVKSAQPVKVGKYEVGILERSAAYWKARGNTTWANAVSGFKIRLFATGAFAIAATGLEIWDLYDDYKNSNTEDEKKIIIAKGFSVASMALGGTLQIFSLLFKIKWIGAIMGPWFAASMLAAGMAYLFTTALLNFIKQDCVGLWLRKCTWARLPKYRHPETTDGQKDEIKALLEIQFSPHVIIKATTEQEIINTGRTYNSISKRNGAWIQIRFPKALRGRNALVNVIISKQPLGVFPVEKIESSVQKEFFDKGAFHPLSDWGKITNRRPELGFYPSIFPAIPEKEDIIWKAWIPLYEKADFLEFKVVYPSDIAHELAHEVSYLYQLELNDEGESTFDGLSKTELTVNHEKRADACQLFIMP